MLVILAVPMHAADDLVFTSAPTTSAPTEQNLLDMARAGDRLVVVGAAGLVAVSDDNGGSWRQTHVPVSATLTGVSFSDDRHGWAVGHGGVILHTSDGGETWTRQFDGNQANEAFQRYATAERQALEARFGALPDDTDLADREAMEYALEDAIFLEEDAQLAVDTGPADPFLDVLFLDAERGLAVGAYGLLFRTTDGGENWQINLSGIDNVDRFHLYKLFADTEEVIYLAGEAGLLYISRDGGTTFERFYDVYDGSLFGLAPLGQRVMAFGLRGNRFVFEGEGGEWSSMDGENRISLYGGTGLSDGGALLVGAGGTIVRLDGMGVETRYQHPSRSTFSNALEAADGRLWLVGMGGLYRFEEAQIQ